MNSSARSGQPSSAQVGAIIALVLFAILAASVYLAGRPYFSWDLSASLAVQTAPWPSGFGTLMRGVSLAGDGFLAASVVVLLVLAGFLVRRAWREAVVLAVAVSCSHLLGILIKLGVGRSRPTPDLVQVFNHPGDHSFPSGHTVYYVVFFGFLWFLTYLLIRSRLLRWPLLTLLGSLVLLVGLSRVYLGAHWASDVVGGYLLGGAVLTTAISSYRRWQPASSTRAALLRPTPSLLAFPDEDDGDSELTSADLALLTVQPAELAP